MLTDKECRAQLKKAEQGELKSWDKVSDGQNLYLRAGKRWVFRYLFDGKPKEMGFGVYPRVSLEAARKARAEAQALVDQGVDPLKDRKRRKVEAKQAQEDAEHTFEAVAREWHAKQEGKNTRDHWQDQLAKLKKHAFPKIGKIPVKNIDKKTLVELMKPIYDRVETAKKVSRIIREVFDYAVDMVYCEYNPAYRLTKTLPVKPEVKHLSCLKSEEQIGNLYIRIRAYGGLPSTVYALMLALIIGDALRSSALRKSKWGFIDFSENTWTVPRKMMKVKTGDDYIVPLPKQAVNFLKELYELEQHGEDDLIFPGRDAGKTLSENTLNSAIRRMGFRQDELCFHGIRGTFSTWCNLQYQTKKDMRFNPELIEKSLDHKNQDKVRRAYNHADPIEARRETLQAWADALDDMARKAMGKPLE